MDGRVEIVVGEPSDPKDDIGNRVPSKSPSAPEPGIGSKLSDRVTIAAP